MRIVISVATVTRDHLGLGKIIDVTVHPEDVIVERNINKAIFAIRNLITQKKSFGVEVFDY